MDLISSTQYDEVLKLGEEERRSQVFPSPQRRTFLEEERRAVSLERSSLKKRAGSYLGAADSVAQRKSVSNRPSHSNSYFVMHIQEEHDSGNSGNSGRQPPQPEGAQSVRREVRVDTLEIDNSFSEQLRTQDRQNSSIERFSQLHISPTNSAQSPPFFQQLAPQQQLQLSWAQSGPEQSLFGDFSQSSVSHRQQAPPLSAASPGRR